MNSETSGSLSPAQMQSEQLQQPQPYTWDAVAQEYPAWDPNLHPHVERNLEVQGVPYGPEAEAVQQLVLDAKGRVEANLPDHEISPQHHQQHIEKAEAIDPQIGQRSEQEQDLIGEMLEIGDTAVQDTEIIATAEQSQQAEVEPSLSASKWSGQAAEDAFYMRTNPFLSKGNNGDQDEILRKRYDKTYAMPNPHEAEGTHLTFDEYMRVANGPLFNRADLELIAQYSPRIDYHSNLGQFRGLTKDSLEKHFLPYPDKERAPLSHSEAFETGVITIDYIKAVRQNIADRAKVPEAWSGEYPNELKDSRILWLTVTAAKETEAGLPDVSYAEVKHTIAMSGDIDFLEYTINKQLYDAADCHFTAEDLLAMQDLYVTNPNFPEAQAVQFSAYKELVLSAKDQDRPQLMREAIKIFGADINIDLVGYVQQLHDGTIAPELAAQGITERGEAGGRQLASVVETMRAQMTDIEAVERKLPDLLHSPFEQKILAMVTRYDEAEFGSHSREGFRQLLEYRLTADKDGLLAPMPVEYQPSEVVEIGLLKQKERDRWTQDVVERYNLLATEFREVAQALMEPEGAGFLGLIENLRNEVISVADNLDQKIQESPDLPDIAKQNMAQRRDKLRELTAAGDENTREYPLRSFKNFEQNFVTLGKNQELHSAMRKVVLAHALRKNKDWLTRSPRVSDNPEVEDVSTVYNFVDHITNQETFKQYFTSKGGASMFNKITNVSGLKAGLEALQIEGVSDKKLAMQFVPTRGIMMELSGHIADACWAGEYDSIAEAMPNMTAVIMKQRPGAANERLAGAGMLIETTDKNTGEPLLVIRGLNPLENVINKLSTQQFYDAFVSYSRGIAEARGRKLAITIDDHAGGAASNRPALFGFLDKQKASLQRIPVNRADTEFNGYDISNDVYAL